MVVICFCGIVIRSCACIFVWSDLAVLRTFHSGGQNLLGNRMVSTMSSISDDFFDIFLAITLLSNVEYEGETDIFVRIETWLHASNAIMEWIKGLAGRMYTIHSHASSYTLTTPICAHHKLPWLFVHFYMNDTYIAIVATAGAICQNVCVGCYWILVITMVCTAQSLNIYSLAAETTTINSTLEIIGILMSSAMICFAFVAAFLAAQLKCTENTSGEWELHDLEKTEY